MNKTQIIVFKIAFSLGMLVISIAAMLLSIQQSKVSATTVTRTYQLLNLSKNIQVTSFNHKEQISLYSKTQDVVALKKLNQAREIVLSELSQMQELVAYNTDLQRQLKIATDFFMAIIAEADHKQPNKGGLIMFGPAISIVAEGGVDNLNAMLIAKLRDFDDVLQKMSQAQQEAASSRSLLAQIAMLISLIVGVVFWLMTLKALRNEVEQREQAEERWRFALEGAGEGVWDWNLATDETYYSKRWYEILGLTEDEAGNGLNVWEKCIHPDDKLNVSECVQDYLDGKTSAYFAEYHTACKDGHSKWVRERGVIVSRTDDGKPLRMIGTLMDITERKEAQVALQASESLLKNLMNINPDLIWLKDINGVYLTCNSRFEGFFGRPASQIIGKTDYDFLSKELADFFRQHDQKAMLESGPSVNEEMITFANDQHTEWLETTKVLMTDANGQALGVLGVGHDITERKRFENEIRIAATAFESQEGMLVTDADNVILRVNHAFTKITGYSADEVIGKTPALLNSGRQNKEFYQAMWGSINATGVWEGEIWNRRKSGEIYPEHLTITAVQDEAGVKTNYVATLTDITMSKAASEEIKLLAFYDPLTHLPNRRLLLDRLQQALAASERSKKKGALLFIDLDHFKNLNDTLGHAVGDLLLQQVASRLSDCVREGDTVSRIGGDEFVVLLEELDKKTIDAANKTELIGHKILDSLNQPYLLAAHKYHCSPSIGATIFDDHQFEIEELLKQADIAMYETKKAGRNALRFFDPLMQEAINVRVDLERELRNAIVTQQFELYYQIQVDNTGHPLGAEALIRWLHPERGMVSPINFVPLAEETGLIIPISQWVLDAACKQLNRWQHHVDTRHLTLSINVSARQFLEAGFAEQVKAAIENHAINPILLKLELTESVLLENVDAIIDTMNALKKIKVHFALDDFGTGYSSLQYLKALPIYQLKIDQSFVRDIADDINDQAIVRTIIAMAQTLNLNVIAEGVETEEQRQLLLNNGCNTYQGYLFGKPLPIDAFEASLKR